MFAARSPSIAFHHRLLTALSLAMFVVIERTSVGMMVRATSSNSDMAACLGIDVVRLAPWSSRHLPGRAGGTIAALLLPLKLGMGCTIIIDCFHHHHHRRLATYAARSSPAARGHDARLRPVDRGRPIGLFTTRC